MFGEINGSNVYNLLSRVLNEKPDKIYYMFSNADAKMWIMPRENMRTAMNLYQPSGIKGKLMKRLFPYLKDIRLVRQKLGIKILNLQLDDKLQEKLKQSFAVNRFEFSVFGGTPSVHQKITMQLNDGNNILGYCKISDSEDVRQMFHREQQILDYLKVKGVKSIPECLFCGDWENNIGIFVQTTLKTNQSTICHHWNHLHWKFLTDLVSATKKELSFDQTDFCAALFHLSDNIGYLPDEAAAIVRHSLERINAYYTGRHVVFSAYHADFTPWNMLVEKGELFVFDFEYSQMTYPPYLDYFHFFTQSAIFEKHWNADKIYEEYLSRKNDLKVYMDQSDFFYQCYLLDIIGRFLERDRGAFSRDVSACLLIWTKLLSRL